MRRHGCMGPSRHMPNRRDQIAVLNDQAESMGARIWAIFVLLVFLQPIQSYANGLALPKFSTYDLMPKLKVSKEGQDKFRLIVDKIRARLLPKSSADTPRSGKLCHRRPRETWHYYDILGYTYVSVPSETSGRKAHAGCWTALLK